MADRSQQGNNTRKKLGQDHYQRIGRMGGAKSRGGGFASQKVGIDGLTGPERARIQGKIGGRQGRGAAKDRYSHKKIIDKLNKKE